MSTQYEYIAKRLAKTYRLQLLESYPLPKDTFRIAVSRTGHLFASEVGTEQYNFNDAAVVKYSQGGREVVAKAQDQVLALAVDDTDQSLWFSVEKKQVLFNISLESGEINETPLENATITSIKPKGARLALADRDNHAIHIFNVATHSLVTYQKAKIIYNPIDIEWLDANRLLVAFTRRLPGRIYPRSCLAVLYLKTGDIIPVSTNLSSDPIDNMWALSCGPEGTFFALGAGYLWKISSNLSLLFRQRLESICNGEPASNIPSYFKTMPAPFYFDLSFNGTNTLHILERSHFRRVYTFRV